MKHVEPAKIKAIAVKLKRKYGCIPFPESRWKRCRICEVWRERWYFNRNKHAPDGLNNYCRDCQRIRSSIYRQERKKK
jgi:hypothetical protein